MSGTHKSSLRIDDRAAAHIEDEFQRRTPASRTSAARRARTIPGGSPSAATHFSPYQVSFQRADGPFVWDLDDHRYIDLHNRFTTLVHGHRFPPVMNAIAEIAAKLGTGPVGAVEPATELAELLTSRITSVDDVAFCNSGTEAGMLAVTLCRQLTGRSLIVKARQGFHGWFGDLLVGRIPASRDATVGSGRTLVAPYGSAESFESLLATRGSEVAAVFIEPVLGAGGVLGADPGFFDRVAAATRAAGAMLVVDEVITLRLATGGVQSRLGLTPDLTMMGKIIGGGLPIGALGGREELMAELDPARGSGVSLYGTFNANPLSCAAGVASLAALDQDTIDEMASLCHSLADRLQERAASLGIPFTVSRAGSLLNVYFREELPSSEEIVDPDPMASWFHLACLNHGLVTYPRGTACLSSVMSEETIDEAGERASAALADVAALVEG